MQEVLSDVQYQTVVMHYFNEMTVDEIAEVFECSRGTVLSRLNYSRAKMKTAIEDYENKSGDKLHGVVVVPFFTTIFKEEAKSLAVPNITIKLPNGQTLATSATKGFATGAKSTVSSIVKATATATVKTKVIAVVCGATILAGISAVGISILAGCNAEKEPTEPSVISSTVQTSTVSSEVSKAIEDNGLKIDKDGNITDKNGKKVEVKDGKVEVKTNDGKTVTVKVDDVKTTVSNNNNSNKGNTERKKIPSQIHQRKTTLLQRLILRRTIHLQKQILQRMIRSQLRSQHLSRANLQRFSQRLKTPTKVRHITRRYISTISTTMQ